MKKALLLLTVLIITSITSFAQQKNPWDKWEWLIGNWVGEGSGQPGKGGGSFAFAYNLDNKIIERKSHTDFPATESRPAAKHDDLLFVYMDYTGNPSKAIYFDNEGHTINYAISYADKSIILVSEKIPGVPIFRLTYSPIDGETINTKFEMSQDGDKFMTYIEGKSKRQK